MPLDPALFRSEAIDAETAAFNSQLEASLAALPPLYTREPREIREERASGRSPQGPVIRSSIASERLIPGPAGSISLRVFLPDRVEGVYFHIHGGGFALGANDLQDPMLEFLATHANVAVVSTDYRLAPEDPYPAGPDDCEAAALWLAENARSEFGVDQAVIGGESAGANLAVVTMLRLRDRHGASPFLGTNLAFGVFDLGGTPSSRAWGDRLLVLDSRMMQWFAEMYAAPELRKEPDVSPLYAGLSGLAPALFTVGTLDPLLDDSLFMYARWLAAGSQAEIEVYPGGSHGFTGQPTRLGRSALQREAEFLRSQAMAVAPAG